MERVGSWGINSGETQGLNFPGGGFERSVSKLVQNPQGELMVKSTLVIRANIKTLLPTGMLFWCRSLSDWAHES